MYLRVFVKRLNPATGKPFRKGDTREDGYRFAVYIKKRKKPDGYFVEQWLNQESFERHCDRIYEGSKRHRIKKRDELAAYKLEKGCADCGYKAHAAALDFDHLPGTTKSFDIGSAVTNAQDWKNVWNEVAKCEVVCANCHRVRTYVERGGAHSGRKDRSA